MECAFSSAKLKSVVLYAWMCWHCNLGLFVLTTSAPAKPSSVKSDCCKTWNVEFPCSSCGSDNKMEFLGCVPRYIMCMRGYSCRGQWPSHDIGWDKLWKWPRRLIETSYLEVCKLLLVWIFQPHEDLVSLFLLNLSLREGYRMKIFARTVVGSL